MQSLRLPTLVIIALLLAALALIRFFWPDGRITLDFKDAPLGNVIASVEHQGRIHLATNVPLETPVTIRVKKAPLMEALETLAVRAEGDLRVVFAAAPTKSQAADGLQEARTGKTTEAWAVGWFPALGLWAGAIPADPRSLPVKPEPGEKNDLQSALRQVAAKSGVMTAVPKDWNPDAKMPSSTLPAGELLRRLVASAGGQIAEGFCIVARGGRDAREGRDRAGGSGQPGGGWQPGGGPGGGFLRPFAGSEGVNPDWLAQRAEALIAQLPPDERTAAKADFDTMRKFREEVRALPEDQQRAKMAEFFSRPDVQEKMQDRQAAADSRRTPEQRAQRYQQYIQRKNQASGTPKS